MKKFTLYLCLLLTALTLAGCRSTKNATSNLAKEEITAAICGLDDFREQQVLFGRYVECQSWAAIACECGYHRRTIMKQHRAGLAHLAARMAEK